MAYLSYFQLLLISSSFLATASDDDSDHFTNDDGFASVRCSGDKYNGSYSNYDQNVAYVLDDITNNAPIENGFKRATYSEEDGGQAYGIGQCRGDVGNESCSTCLTNAAINMSSTCPSDTERATVISNKCSLKYSDQNFFGNNTSSFPYSPYCCNDNINNKEMLRPNLDESFFDSLIDDQINATTMFAKISNTPPDDGSVVQTVFLECRRDLTAANCTNCLKTAAAALVNNCKGQDIGKCVGEGCNLKYAWKESVPCN